ncbi:hypothetical protein BBJ28_00001596 [Nothophytophthora sp. Chile5]|nr:hypothetical protein BBJ28_00001596 [Nothophytophthora sp. Chile5]
MKPTQDNGLVLLTSVRVVCRNHLGVYAPDPVLHLIDAFADPSHGFTLIAAVQNGSARLFPRVLHTVDCDSTLLRLEKLQSYRLAMCLAAELGALWMVEQLYERHPAALNGETALAAGSSGNLALLQWVYNHNPVLLRVNSYAAVLSAFDTAATNGDFAAVQTLVQTFPTVVYNLGAAVKAVHLDIVRWLQQNAHCECKGSAKDDAAKSGDLEMVQFLQEHFPRAMPSAFQTNWAAERGHLAVIQWLHDNHMVHPLGCTAYAMNRAASNGHLEMVQWLHEHRKEGCTTGAMNAAAEFGHLHIVKWLHSHRSEGCTTLAMDRAARNGHLNVVKWLHEHPSEGCSTGAMDSAAEKNHMEIVQWLHENRGEGCTTRAMDHAARIGNLEMVQYLHENRAEGCTHVAMDQAARNGFLEVVKFLHQNRAEGCSHDAMDGAAAENQLEVVKWLHENRSEGCTTAAMNVAAEMGFLEMVRWLHTNQPDKIAPEARECAACYGHLEVLKILHPICSRQCSAREMDTAASNGHLNVVKWLDRNCREGFTAAAMDGAATACHADVVEWLYENGAELCSNYMMVHAIAKGDFKMLEFFRNVQTDRYCPTVARAVAARRGHVEVLSWLNEHYPDVR